MIGDLDGEWFGGWLRMHERDFLGEVMAGTSGVDDDSLLWRGGA